MDKNELNNEFWEKEINYYMSLKYPPSIKYQSWQPAKWASNSGVVERISTFFHNPIEQSLELGAGSCAFSFVMNQILRNKIVAVDVCKRAVDFGNIISNDLNVNLHYVKEDFFNIKNLNKSSDIVFSLGVIEHYNNEQQQIFINLNKQMSKRYVLIAIPNQESWIFKNYIRWVTKNANLFEDKHQELNLDILKKEIESAGLRVLYADGFHMFLSEFKFWKETSYDKYEFFDRLKGVLIAQDPVRYSRFPHMDFTYEDINTLKRVENLLTRDERIQHGFMNYILAEINR